MPLRGGYNATGGRRLVGLDAIHFHFSSVVAMRFIAPFVALASAAQVNSSTGVARCTKADLEAFHAAVVATPAYPACVADVGLTVDQFNFEQVVMNSTDVDKLLASANCAALYHNAQSLSAPCLELQLFHGISWDMAAAVLKVASYPKVSDKCNKNSLFAAFAPLIFDENVYACLQDAELHVNDLNDGKRFQKKDQLPTIDQIERVRNSTACRAVYAKAEDVLVTLPHCQFDKSNGTDIHILEALSFDVLVDWIEFGIRVNSEAKHGNFPPVALSLAAHFGYAPVTDTSNHSVAAVPLYMAVGAFLAVVAMYVAQQRKQGYEPIRGPASSHVVK
ncbi:hypothetical protein H310_05175 [Aphanomyces invadans]|uniref:Uncharacterized protein n=1 Tax=Aphanomyces invadans TaxID=157072 RepID=A0A024UC78_9STRA|nr:hypothetical protein H310_05175 [Aphanomyces invadans]ETW03810.1 hypothetical protein H310_05175 [Aphanomyces invadans]RHY29651.1 hypothetical protein DYB32_004980 [Aphanomyces invadans]|eukprot:XP_008868039.1 hypothetical protein H310_05175 [Aphanomyces invadans]